MDVALSEALAGLEAISPEALSDPALHEVVLALVRAESRLGALRARLVAAWDARRVWADDGSKSAAARLGRECALSPLSARRELRRARALAEMPATAAALRAGTLSVDQAELVALGAQPALRSPFRRDEAVLVEQVSRLRFSHGHRLLRYWLAAAHDEAGVAPEVVRHQGRHLSAVRTYGEVVSVSGILDVVGGTEFLTELTRREQVLFEADWAEARARHGRGARPEHLARRAAQRRADALVEMARRSAALAAGTPLPRPLVTVLVGYEGFARTCELDDGTVLSPRQLAPLLCRADIERVVFDGPARVLEVGVRRRLFTGALRRAIEVRDRHCQHPSGCDVPAEQCQVDHVVPYAEGGLTTQDNGRLHCAVHNRQRVGEMASVTQRPRAATAKRRRQPKRGAEAKAIPRARAP
jgi:hypothetical protein